MKKIKLHLDIDIEINTQQDLTSVITRYITQCFENYASDLLKGSNFQSTFEIKSWDIKTRLETAPKQHIQTQAERVTDLADIKAYFSSDGPAVVASIHKLEAEAIPLILGDINSALREAHYQYITKIREQGDI